MSSPVETFDDVLPRMISASIERERRTLFGVDSKLELFTISGEDWTLELSLASHWVARRTAALGGEKDEWELEIPEALITYPDVSNLEGVKIRVHVGFADAESLSFRIVSVNRPLKRGHPFAFKLEAV